MTGAELILLVCEIRIHRGRDASYDRARPRESVLTRDDDGKPHLRVGRKYERRAAGLLLGQPRYDPTLAGAFLAAEIHRRRRGPLEAEKAVASMAAILEEAPALTRRRSRHRAANLLLGMPGDDDRGPDEPALLEALAHCIALAEA